MHRHIIIPDVAAMRHLSKDCLSSHRYEKSAQVKFNDNAILFKKQKKNRRHSCWLPRQRPTETFIRFSRAIKMAVNVVAQVFVQFLSIWFPPKNSRAKLVQQRAPISIFIFSSFPEKEKKQTTGEGKKKGKFKIFGCGSDASAQYLGIKQFTTSLAKIRKNPNQKIDVQNKTKTHANALVAHCYCCFATRNFVFF